MHREDLGPEDITVHEGIPLTPISKTIVDFLRAGPRIDLVGQAISDARREGFIGDSEAKRLQRKVKEHLKTVPVPQSQIEPAIP